MVAVEVLGLVGGLVGLAVILPALIFLCGARPKEAPIGASMANRRGVPKGPVQIDPLLQPQWAAKQAERDAQLRQQHAVVLSAKNLRPGNKGTGNGDEKMHVVLRQPSTMADKYALPSHLTKQLGQPSRRTMAANATAIPVKLQTPSQEGDGKLERPSQSPPLQRPEVAYTSDSFSGASNSRSAANEFSAHGAFPVAAAGYPQESYGRQLSNHPSSNRRLLANASLASGQDGPAAPAGGSLGRPRREDPGDEDTDLREADDGPEPPSDQRLPLPSTQGMAWPQLDDGCDEDGRRSPDAAPGDAGASASAPAPAATRPSHPRIAALSPVRYAGSGSGGSGGGGGPAASAPNPWPESGSGRRVGAGAGAGEEGARPGSGEEAPRSCGSDAVERLVQGVDWSAAALGEGPDGDRRISSDMAPQRSRSAAVAREQNAAPPSADVSLACHHRHPATVHGGVVAVAAAGGGGGGDASPGQRGVSRALSSREGLPRAASRLASPTVGRSFRAGSTNGRWVASGVGGGDSGRGRSSFGGVGSGGSGVNYGRETSLPGSTDGEYGTPPGVAEEPYAPGELFYKSVQAPQVPSAAPSRSSIQRPCGVSFGTETAAAVAASAPASAGSPVRSSVGGGRGTATWSGMVAPQLADVEAGPGSLGSAAEAGVTAGSVPGSRATRAQALLARNKSTLSRLAAAASADAAVRL